MAKRTVSKRSTAPKRHTEKKRTAARSAAYAAAERARKRHPLRLVREKKKLTREQLAKKSKVSIACIRDIECRGAVPRAPTMARIAKVLRANALDLHRAVFEASLAA